MNHKIIANKKRMKKHIQYLLMLLFLQCSFLVGFAQEEKVATMQMAFGEVDSVKTCTVTVKSDSTPVVGTEVHLYVKSLYALLELGKAVATDENGEAAIEFPSDLPGNGEGIITVIAKIEKDETYGDVETQSNVKWGAAPKKEGTLWNSRSLSASREKAPMILVVASTGIIVLIWGTIFYVIFQLFKIKKSAKLIPEISKENG